MTHEEFVDTRRASGAIESEAGPAGAGTGTSATHLPDFIIAGAMKCATSSLHGMLNEHPDIFIPPGELRFFAVDDFDQIPHLYTCGKDRWTWRDFDENWDVLFPWYESFFRDCAGVKCVGEDSTAYLCSERAPSRIARVLPNVRLIFILRDPVERAYSHYWHNVRTGNAFFDFETTLRLCPGAILERGKYMRHLSRYYEHFPASQIKIVFFEDFVKQPHAVTQSLLPFIGVDPERYPAPKRTHFNAGRFHRFTRMGLLRNRLLPEFFARGYLDWLPDMPEPTPISPWKRWLKLCLDRVNPLVRRRAAPMAESTREFLRRYYLRENEGLDQLLGVDLRDYWASASSP